MTATSSESYYERLLEYCDLAYSGANWFICRLLVSVFHTLAKSQITDGGKCTDVGTGTERSNDGSCIPLRFKDYVNIFSTVRLSLLHHTSQMTIQTIWTQVSIYHPAKSTIIRCQVESMQGPYWNKFSRSIHQASIIANGGTNLIAKKTDSGLLLCVDYSAHNSATVMNLYPPTLITKLVDGYSGAHIMIKLDFCHASHRIRINKCETVEISFHLQN